MLGSSRPWLALAALTCTAAPAWAADVVGGGLTAFVAFDEGAGATSLDLSGHGNSAALSGGTWGNGFYRTNGASAVIHLRDSPSLRSDSFTVDFWVRTLGSTWNAGNARYFSMESASTRGPELFNTFTGTWVGSAFETSLPFRYTMRVHNACVRFDEPTVGTRTGTGLAPQNEDHWGQSSCATKFPETGPPIPIQHVVFVKDQAARTVRLHVGEVGAPLVLVYDGTYTEFVACTAANDGLYLGNAVRHQLESRLDAEFHQLVFYTRALSTAELDINHAAGPAASLPPQPDGGVDAGSIDAGGPDAGLVDAGEAGGGDCCESCGEPYTETTVEVTTERLGCSCLAVPGGRAWALGIVALLALATRRRLR